MPEVSIVVAVYNTEQYLRECLDSLANQTLKDLEIVCVDDASPDHSYAILEEYAAKDARFKIYRNEKNSGVSATKARGADLATGKYLYFIDCDDWIEPDAMEVCRQIAEARQTDLVIIDFAPFGDDGLVRMFDIRKKYPRPVDRLMTGAEFFDEAIWEFPPWLRFIRRSFYEAKKPFFDPRAIPDDIVFSMNCDLRAEKVVYSGKIFYHHRLRKSSVTFKAGKNLPYFLGLRVSLKTALALLRGRTLSDAAQTRIAAWKRDQINKLGNYVRNLTAEERSAALQAHPELEEYLELVELAYPVVEKLTLTERERDGIYDRAELAEENYQTAIHSSSYRLGHALLALPIALKKLFHGRSGR